MTLQDQVEAETAADRLQRRPRWVVTFGAIVLALAVAVTASYGVRQHWNLMPDYGRGWHVGAGLQGHRLSGQCASTAAQRYPGLVDQSSGVGHSPQAWAYLAGCIDAQHGYQDMRWQLEDRRMGSRGMPED